MRSFRAYSSASLKRKGNVLFFSFLKKHALLPCFQNRQAIFCPGQLDWVTPIARETKLRNIQISQLLHRAAQVHTINIDPFFERARIQDN